MTGVAGAALAAVGSSRVWVIASATVADVGGSGSATAEAEGSQAAPLALALGLVALAAWGAILVTRGQSRRLIAVIGALAALGCGIAAVAGREDAQRIANQHLLGSGTDAIYETGFWFFATLAGAVVAAVTLAIAALQAHTWPEMSARYDAHKPTGPADQARDPASQDLAMGDPATLWKALDDGRDPTE